MLIGVGVGLRRIGRSRCGGFGDWMRFIEWAYGGYELLLCQ